MLLHYCGLKRGTRSSRECGRYAVDCIDRFLIESTDAGSEDMDGDGSPDWDPAVGPGV